MVAHMDPQHQPMEVQLLMAMLRILAVLPKPVLLQRMLEGLTKATPTHKGTEHMEPLPHLVRVSQHMAPQPHQQGVLQRRHR